MTRVRRARLLAFAKINLDLRVLCRRPDNYHELRTIFQTISLADSLGITFTPSRKTDIQVTGPQIPDNLIVRAAESCLDAMRLTGQIEFDLVKRIPMGAGLGGGSSDAAAVLLALPVLAGGTVDWPTLLKLGQDLGSDVPFFLLGGTAVALGRGTEIYPLPDRRPQMGVVIAPELHISTAEAYHRLSAQLTSKPQQNKIVSFQSSVWGGSAGDHNTAETPSGENDFESVVFEQYPALKSIKLHLRKLGANPALMSGSGSAVFGLFPDRAQVRRAIQSFGKERVFPIKLVSRARFRAEWQKRLRSHTREKSWPPQSRYAQ
jgi:4-diphosphocytidyl-2-C-methyl-D-erythritol kinase